MPSPFKSRSGKVWWLPSNLGRTKQLNLRLYMSSSFFLNSGDCSISQSEKPSRISSILLLASCVAFGVAHLDVLAVLVRDGLGDVGRGVVDGVAHEGHAVEQARFGTDCILVIDTRAEFGGTDIVLVRAGVVADGHVGVEQP